MVCNWHGTQDKKCFGNMFNLHLVYKGKTCEDKQQIVYQMVHSEVESMSIEEKA